MAEKKTQSLLGEGFWARFLDGLAHADEYSILEEEIDPSKANPEFLAEIEKLKAQRNIEEEK